MTRYESGITISVEIKTPIELMYVCLLAIFIIQCLMRNASVNIESVSVSGGGGIDKQLTNGMAVCHDREWHKCIIAVKEIAIERNGESLAGKSGNVQQKSLSK